MVHRASAFIPVIHFPYPTVNVKRCDYQHIHTQILKLFDRQNFSPVLYCIFVHANAVIKSHSLSV